jgi:sarcosine oxidase subunit gamma
MSTPARVSPLADVQSAHAARWTEIEHMRVVAAFSNEQANALNAVALGDLSHRPRAGVKGPGAAAALNAAGINTPSQPNRWCRSDGALVTRLGLTEYLIEADQSNAAVSRVLALSNVPDVYPVPHYDAALIIMGPKAVDLFRQTCSVDMATLDPNDGALVLTSVVGVGATVAALQTPTGIAYQMWLDGTYASYMWETLCEIAHDMGGGPIGFDALSRVGL